MEFEEHTNVLIQRGEEPVAFYNDTTVHRVPSDDMPLEEGPREHASEFLRGIHDSLAEFSGSGKRMDVYIGVLSPLLLSPSPSHPLTPCAPQTAKNAANISA